MERTHLSTGKVEEGCEFKNLRFGGDQSCDFLWPPNNYTCSFCKRQFRSAQALGGHMNVHRRDRARLRQLPSWACDCPNTSANPNPNPSSNLNPKFSPSSSSPSSKFFPYSYTHHSLLSPSLTSFSSRSHEEKKPIIKCPRRHTLSPQCGDLAKKGSMRGVLGVGEPKSTYAHKNELVVLKTREVINLDLEMRLKDPKEVLDLELRLGYL